MIDRRAEDFRLLLDYLSRAAEVAERLHERGEASGALPRRLLAFVDDIPFYRDLDGKP